MSDSRKGYGGARLVQGGQQGELDVTKTHLTKGVTPQRALQLIDSLPLPDEGEAWRSRERVRGIVMHLPAELPWRVQIYVRLDHKPPAAPLELHPPRLCVLTYRPDSRQFGFVMLLSPGGSDHMLPSCLQREQELLRLAEWQAQHMPEIPRHGEHEGMPGQFRILGCHHSQHARAHAEVEQFGPKHCCCT
eukprot:2529588-Prymnesium_polylepis.1